MPIKTETFCDVQYKHWEPSKTKLTPKKQKAALNKIGKLVASKLPEIFAAWVNGLLHKHPELLQVHIRPFNDDDTNTFACLFEEPLSTRLVTLESSEDCALIHIPSIGLEEHIEYENPNQQPAYAKIADFVINKEERTREACLKQIHKMRVVLLKIEADCKTLDFEELDQLHSNLCDGLMIGSGNECGD